MAVFSSKNSFSGLETLQGGVEQIALFVLKLINALFLPQNAIFNVSRLKELAPNWSGRFWL